MVQMNLDAVVWIVTPILIMLFAVIRHKNNQIIELRRQVVELQDRLDKVAARDIANLDPAIIQQSAHPEVPATAPDIDPAAESSFDLGKYAEK